MINKIVFFFLFTPTRESCLWLVSVVSTGRRRRGPAGEVEGECEGGKGGGRAVEAG